MPPWVPDGFAEKRIDPGACWFFYHNSGTVLHLEKKVFMFTVTVYIQIAFNSRQ